MEWLFLSWPLSGFFAWLWIMTHEEMVDDVYSAFVAGMMAVLACIGGPFVWYAALKDLDR